MAKAKAPMNGTPKQSSKQVVIKPVIEAGDDLGFSYANHAEVGHSPHEFFILFTRLPGKVPSGRLESAKATGELHIDAQVQVLIPPSLVGGLIKALTDQRDKYEKEFGPINETWKGKAGERK